MSLCIIHGTEQCSCPAYLIAMQDNDREMEENLEAAEKPKPRVTALFPQRKQEVWP